MPVKDALSKLISDPDQFIEKETVSYFRDLSNNVDFLISSFEHFREMLKDLLDLQMNTLSQSMNAVMKPSGAPRYHPA